MAPDQHNIPLYLSLDMVDVCVLGNFVSVAAWAAMFEIREAFKVFDGVCIFDQKGIKYASLFNFMIVLYQHMPYLDKG